MGQFLIRAIMILVLSLATAWVVAQPASPPVSSTPPTISANRTGQIWNLKNADIRAVIQTVSLLTGKTFIVDPRVQGRVTLISQRPMSVKEIYKVFLSLLEVLNYVAVPSGRVIKILPADEARQFAAPLATREHPGQGAEVVVRVVPIIHVSAAQLVPVLRPMIKNWGTINAYIPSNSLILVDSANNIERLVKVIDRLDREEVSRISLVRLRYANAAKLVAILNSLQQASRDAGRVSNVSLAADTENNTILLSGNSSNRMMMRSLIRRLDTVNASGLGDTVVVHLNYLSAKKLAPVLAKIAEGSLLGAMGTTGKAAAKGNGKNAALAAAPVSASGISIQAEESSNAVIIHAKKRMIRSLLRVIRKLDVRPSEVLVQAIIVRINQDLLDQLGIVWGTTEPDNNNNENNGNGSTNPPAETTISRNTGILRLSPGIGFLKGSSLVALIHALKSHGSSDILSTPSVVVLNNSPALISDGRNIGIINRQYSTNVVNSTDNNTVPFNTFERTDVTLSLSVTPTIAPNSMLRLKIKQKDDNVDIASSRDPENPVLDVSKITTNVLVKSGDILVLGGLVNNDLQKSHERVPILGAIPIIGRLFRYNNHDIQKRDLMIFIRPIILNNNLKARKVTVQHYHYMRSQQIRARSGESVTPQDLPILPPLVRPRLVTLPPPA